ncbi:MAG TPA: hypothetical protein VJT49_03110 [Amycolatopsis sp.]|uniref:hypothetical protein n=1 Tax=Amycolatopsis sp. TaxID=37632 RepID=UPI002B467AE0|nr:hypothetical protein [Amycolatopsis sp.]HKS44105.1 hypothetical protein [Amycolatopsis sp.]
MTPPDESDDVRRGKDRPPAPSPADETPAPAKPPKPATISFWPPRAPSPADETPALAKPPRPVTISFWLWIVSALLTIANYAYVFAYRQQIVDQVVKNTHDPRYTPEMIATGTTRILVIALIGAVCVALLYGLFAYKARQGTRSARTVLTVLWLVVGLLQLTLGLLMIYLGLLSVLLGLIALLLMYLPAVWPYFPKAGRG